MLVVLPDPKAAEEVFDYHCIELQHYRKQKRAADSARGTEHCTICGTVCSTIKGDACGTTCAEQSKEQSSDIRVKQHTNTSKSSAFPRQRARSNTFPLFHRRIKTSGCVPGLDLTIDSSIGFSSTPTLVRCESEDFNSVIEEFKSAVRSMKELRQQKLSEVEYNPYATNAPESIQKERQEKALIRYQSTVANNRGVYIRATSLDDQN
jgi:hypothetical protein